MSNAISYLRFSTPKQAEGDSYRRQIAATEKYCKENGLTISKHLEDLGISAWSGKNLGDDAALGGFLNLVKAGKIPKGTVLIVENLDRLTRGKILKAVSLFTDILTSGVDIVTTMDGKRYSEQSVSDNPMELMISITYLTRGNNESETKSKRIKEAWEAKRIAIQKGEFTKVRSFFWLDNDGKKYILNKENAEKVRLIFSLFNQGYGVFNIIKELRKRDIKPTGKLKKWTRTLLYKLIDNPATIGVCEIGKLKVGNYFPPVISEEEFYKAQSNRQQKEQGRGYRGRTGKLGVNLFTGLCKCTICGDNMIKWFSSRAKKDGTKDTFLICASAKDAKHPYKFTPFQKFSDSFLFVFNEVNFSKMMFSGEHKVKDNSEVIHGKIAEIQKTIARVSDAIIKSDSPALVARLTKLEVERKQLEKEYSSELAANAGRSNARADYSDLIEKIATGLEKDAFRLSLRNLMRKHIEKIEVKPDGYRVHFIGSSDTITVELSKDDFTVRYWDESYIYDYFSFKGKKHHPADAVTTVRKSENYIDPDYAKYKSGKLKSVTR